MNASFCFRRAVVCVDGQKVGRRLQRLSNGSLPWVEGVVSPLLQRCASILKKPQTHREVIVDTKPRLSLHVFPFSSLFFSLGPSEDMCCTAEEINLRILSEKKENRRRSRTRTENKTVEARNTISTSSRGIHIDRYRREKLKIGM